MRLASLALCGLVLSMASAGGVRAAPSLAFPLACEIGRTCEIQHYVDRDPGPGVLDYRCGQRTYHEHNGVDIRLLDMAAQRAGIDVLAAAPGRVTGLRDGVQDISVHAPGAPSVTGKECGNGVVVDHGGGWVTQYCHLARGSVRVKVGDVVATGQPLARVGLSGNTEFPHLHLTVRQGAQTVDPFAPDMTNPTACRAQTALWDAGALRQLAYKAGAVLNVGFTTGAIDNAAIEAGGVTAASAGAPGLVAYVRLIELQAGDQIELVLTGPGGKALAQTAPAALTGQKAQYVAYVGVTRKAAGWPPGTYIAEVRVRRAGAVAITRRWQVTL